MSLEEVLQGSFAPLLSLSLRLPESSVTVDMNTHLLSFNQKR